MPKTQSRVALPDKRSSFGEFPGLERVRRPETALLPPIETEEALIKQMTTPSPAVKKAVGKLDGPVMILGVGGKMGPTLAELLANAGAEVIGVSRFSRDPRQYPFESEDYLNSVGVQTVRCDLLDDNALRGLSDAPHVFSFAASKFGVTGNEPFTWAMNFLVQGKVMERYRDSQVIHLSSGNVYSFTPVDGAGSAEEDPKKPVGEYAVSRLGGERIVEYFSNINHTPSLSVRLFYATELRYGIIRDVADKVNEGKPIDLAMGHVNQIWQGDANAMLAQMFPHCETPTRIINLTGGEILSVRDIATKVGRILGKEPRFEGVEGETALLGDSRKAIEMLGEPAISTEQMIYWVANWVKQGGKSLGKPTKYERRDGRF